MNDFRRDKVPAIGMNEQSGKKTTTIANKEYSGGSFDLEAALRASQFGTGQVEESSEIYDESGEGLMKGNGSGTSLGAVSNASLEGGVVQTATQTQVMSTPKEIRLDSVSISREGVTRSARGYEHTIVIDHPHIYTEANFVGSEEFPKDFDMLNKKA